MFYYSFGQSKVPFIQCFTVPMSPFTILMSQCQSQGNGSDDDDNDKEDDAEDAEGASVGSQADVLVGHVGVLCLLFRHLQVLHDENLLNHTGCATAANSYQLQARVHPPHVLTAASKLL